MEGEPKNGENLKNIKDNLPVQKVPNYNAKFEKKEVNTRNINTKKKLPK